MKQRHQYFVKKKQKFYNVVVSFDLLDAQKQLWLHFALFAEELLEIVVATKL